VQGVSAFDHFVHEELRARMLRIQSEPIPRFGSSVSAFPCRAFSSTYCGGVGWLEAEVREQHGYQSFQHPEKSLTHFGLSSNGEFWNAVGIALARPPQTSSEHYY